MHYVVDPLNVLQCAVYSGIVVSIVGAEHSPAFGINSRLVTNINQFKAAALHIHVTGFTVVIS